MRYQIGVASHDHVLNGIEGGFCQLGHGKKTALEKMKTSGLFITRRVSKSRQTAKRCKLSPRLEKFQPNLPSRHGRL